jgi:TetR/AcrR family transcriptional regulator, lmrAB and yxaGH operons repressor
MTSIKSTISTRDRLIAAMLDALRRRGLHGIGLNELLKNASAPKGVLYHHFPGGKNELAVAAIQTAVMHLRQSLASLVGSKQPPEAILIAWMNGAHQQLAKSLFERGCPLATVALESGAADIDIRTALSEAFHGIRGDIAAMLVQARIDTQRAGQLASLIVSAYEGALIQSRVAGHGQTMQDVTAVMTRLLAFELQVKGNS